MNYEDSYRELIIQLLITIEHTTMVVVSNDDEFAKYCNNVITM